MTKPIKYKELQRSFNWTYDFDYIEQFEDNIKICLQLLIQYQKSDAHKYGSQTRFNNELKEFIHEMHYKLLDMEK